MSRFERRVNVATLFDVFLTKYACQNLACPQDKFSFHKQHVFTSFQKFDNFSAMKGAFNRRRYEYLYEYFMHKTNIFSLGVFSHNTI
jgi:hypothetical protein